MKKISLSLVALFIVLGASAQVFNTAQTLKKGNFSVGIEPAIIDAGGTDFILFGHLGYGLTSGIDLGGKFGVLYNTTYVGADVEFRLNNNFSLAAGAHSFGDFGLDFTLLGTYGVASNVNLYGGFDADINFGTDVYFPLWIPVGVEVAIGDNVAFLFEAEIGLTDPAYHIFGGGVNFYF